MRILMIVWTNVAADTRVRREATALVGAGHTVHIIGKDVPSDFVPPEGVTVAAASGSSALKRASGAATSRPMSPAVRMARWALLPSHVASSHRSWVASVRTLAAANNFDVVHAHDFTALPVAAELAAERCVPYVYDTHEYWFGRSGSGRPTPWRRRADRRRERTLGSQAAAVITVGDGIADQLKVDFGWDVTVVRNSFPEVSGDDSGPDQERRSRVPIGVVYAGRVGEHRDLETVARATAEVAPLRVTIAGPADPTFLASFNHEGVVLLDSMPVDEVTELLREQGLALVSLASRGENHRLAMPNKLFHAVHAGVPVVAANVEHLAKVVDQYGLGTLYEPGDVASLVAAIKEAVARYDSFASAVRSAASELSWTADAERLVAVYASLPVADPTTSPTTGARDD